MKIGITTLLALLATPVAAEGLAGVWSIGEARNCVAGPAWVLFADGQYAEVTLPAGPISSVGVWKDEGQALAYTHAHLPFAGLEKPGTMRRMAMTARTADRLDMVSPTGRARAFHRCPADRLKAPAGAAAH